jgi:leucyl-tRNA synthetase
MVHGKTYRLPGSERPIPPDQVTDKGAQAFLKSTGQELSTSWEKMSKSKYNGIDPEKVVGEYGADTVRLFMLFKAPVDQVLDWDASQIQGQLRWIRRLWTLVHTLKEATPKPTGTKLSTEESKLQRQLQETIRDNTKEMLDFSFNTAIARLMKLSNAMTDVLNGQTGSDESSIVDSSSRGPVSPVVFDSMNTLLRLLYPMAPHFASETWQLLHVAESKHISETGWPVFDPKQLVDDSCVFSIQVNGKFAGMLELDPDIVDDDSKVNKAILESPIAKKHAAGKAVKKLIVTKARKFANILL